jgi:hypothetical protein
MLKTTVRKMESKPTVRDDFTPVRIATIKNPESVGKKV